MFNSVPFEVVLFSGSSLLCETERLLTYRRTGMGSHYCVRFWCPFFRWRRVDDGLLQGHAVSHRGEGVRLMVRRGYGYFIVVLMLKCYIWFTIKICLTHLDLLFVCFIDQITLFNVTSCLVPFSEFIPCRLRNFNAILIVCVNTYR